MEERFQYAVSALPVATQSVPLNTVPNPENIDYLRTKRDRMGHLLEGLDDLI